MVLLELQTVLLIENQPVLYTESILKEINPDYSLEGLMLKLKFQYFGHLMQRSNLLELKAKGEGSRG